MRVTIHMGCRWCAELALGGEPGVGLTCVVACTFDWKITKRAFGSSCKTHVHLRIYSNVPVGQDMRWFSFVDNARVDACLVETNSRKKVLQTACAEGGRPLEQGIRAAGGPRGPAHRSRC